MLKTNEIRTPWLMNWLNLSMLDLQGLDRVRFGFFLQFMFITTSGAIAWAAICLGIGKLHAALVPLAYIVSSLLTLFYIQQAKDIEKVYSIFVLLSIMLPFVFQFALGGIMVSGFVMVWCMVGLMGAVTFMRNKSVMQFFFLTLMFYVFAACHEYFIVNKAKRGLTVLVMTSFNTMTVLSMLFLMAVQFIKAQKQAFSKLNAQRRQIAQRNEQIEQGLRVAGNLQKNSLPSRKKFLRRFKDHFIEHDCLGDIGACFYWLGECYGKEILVNIKGQWDGVQNVLIQLMLSNHLREIVYRDNMHRASDISVSVSRFVDEMLTERLGISEIETTLNVITFDWTDLVLESAGSGYYVYIKDRYRSGAIERVAGSGIQLKSAKGALIGQAHTVSLSPHGSLVIYNQALKDCLSLSEPGQRVEDLLHAWSDSEEMDFSELRNELFRARHQLREQGLSNEKEVLAIGIDLAMMN